MKIEEALAGFVGKEVIVYTVSNGLATGGAIECTIDEIGDGWLRIKQENDNESIMNIDNVIRVRDYPRNKNGKKKMIFD